MNAPTPHPLPPYSHTPLFPLGPDKTKYRKITADGVRVEKVMGQDVVVVAPEALRALSEAAFEDINHLLRPAHLKQLRAILDDPQATANDKFVAYDLLKNANIAAGGVLPMCQDTGTAIIMGKKGRRIFTDGSDEGALAQGARDAYLKRNLRYSQLAPISMFEEKNTKSNMPAQVEIYAEGEDAYKFLFVAKGGGSANKTFLFQATPSILTHDRMLAFLKEKILTLGTAACPPYHLAIVIGGTSAELNLKTVKLASTKYLDELPTQGSEDGHAFRDLAMEQEVLKMTQATGVGAQFGGKYFCHDVRVIRLPRHGASLPIGLGVSCSADRQALGKITRDGVYLEELERNPAQYLPDVDPATLGGEVVHIDLRRPMKEILAQLAKHPIKTRLSLTGPMIVARDLAHSKLRVAAPEKRQVERRSASGCRRLFQVCPGRDLSQRQIAQPAQVQGEHIGRVPGQALRAGVDAFVESAGIVERLCPRRGHQARRGCERLRPLGLGQRGILAAQQDQQPGIVHVSKRVGVVERERPAEVGLRPIPVPLAAELRERQLTVGGGAIAVERQRPHGRAHGDVEGQRRLDQAVEAQEVVGVRQRHMGVRVARVPFDRVLQVLDRLLWFDSEGHRHFAKPAA